MINQFLFEKGDAACPSPGEVGAAEKTGGIPRLRVPQRDQVEMHCTSLDHLIEPDHPVRAIWAVVCGLDLRRWLGEIKAVEGTVGRDSTDPRLLAALWIFATLEGIAYARELDRLCQKHWAYQWLCGGVSVNYHMLSDFRSQGGDKWDELLTQIVASLLTENLVTMKRVAQDGMRVQAHAGKGSFRRRPRLEQFLEDARQQVQALKKQAEESPEDLTKRERAAPNGPRKSGSNAWRKRCATATSCKSSGKPRRKPAVASRPPRGLRPPIRNRGP